MSSIWQQLSIAVGHATNFEGGTGCTVIRGVDAPFRCAATLVGRGNGTRDLGTASPSHNVDRTDAILLTGGSAYGLDAAGGIMRWMEERGRGHPIGGGVVPIVPAAVIFDLAPVGRFDARPDANMAYAACDSASTDNIQEGSIGAGTGALVGKTGGLEGAMKGGVGVAEYASGDIRAGAIAVLNALGDVRDASGNIIAGACGPDGNFLDALQLCTQGSVRERLEREKRTNTTLAVVVVDRPLSKHTLWQVARASTAALYRRITPTGTQFDGDVVFAICPHGEPASDPGLLPGIEVAATLALEAAIERGVRTARGRDGFPGLGDS